MIQWGMHKTSNGLSTFGHPVPPRPIHFGGILRWRWAAKKRRIYGVSAAVIMNHRVRRKVSVKVRGERRNPGNADFRDAVAFESAWCIIKFRTKFTRILIIVGSTWFTVVGTTGEHEKVL